MYVMKIANKVREKELKVSPTSKVDALFNQVKTFFFESNNLSHNIEEFDFRGCLNRVYPRPFRAKNIRSVSIVKRTLTGDIPINGYDDEDSLKKCLRAIIAEVADDEANVADSIVNEISELIHQNCCTIEDYRQFKNHVQSFFHFNKK